MAKSTLRLQAELGERFHTQVSGAYPFVIDQPKPMGMGAGPNPLDVFLSSLGACICAIGRIIAQQEKLPLRGLKVSLEGDIDKDYLMGQTREGRAGFTEVRTRIEVDADMSQAEKEAFVARIAERCPIADNMVNGTKIAHVIA
ncbi:MAG: OsmC family protein [Thermoanaerobaculaceae bacterium]|nr:OsmC family protein [Thermoanaerobaculaceae bacterium]MDI9620733.1 OsmC family protein [Acidobacteriota bacterium]NLH10083.1 OsmC family protein [Holophagae bacterium]HPW56806.1 OsmC family protein [Thermoanaerobaculaceae bacterium]